MNIRYICILMMATVLFHTGCATSRCGYDGDCFDVKINGVDVIPLSSERLTEPYQKIPDPGVASDARDAKWQVREPVNSKIDVLFAVNSENGKAWIGDNPAMNIIVIPLDNQVIKGDYALSRADNVRVEGKAPVTLTKVMKNNELPPGNYLFKVRIRGSNNWDRKTIFVMVK